MQNNIPKSQIFRFKVDLNYHVLHDVFFSCDLFHLVLDYPLGSILRLFQSVFVIAGWVPPQIKTKKKPKKQTIVNMPNTYTKGQFTGAIVVTLDAIFSFGGCYTQVCFTHSSSSTQVRDFLFWGMLHSSNLPRTNKEKPTRSKVAGKRMKRNQHDLLKICCFLFWPCVEYASPMW